MIQRDKLESRYAGRAAFVERLLGVFASTHAPLSGELRRAVENGDALGIARRTLYQKLGEYKKQEPAEDDFPRSRRRGGSRRGYVKKLAGGGADGASD